MNIKKIIIGGAASALLFGVVAISAFAAPITPKVPTAPGLNKIICFDGTTDGGFGGVCTLNSNGAKGTATLDNTVAVGSADYAGVYINATTMTGQTLGQITQLGYNYSGNIAPQPGNLSLNVPVDTTGDNVNDTYLFVDAFYCPGTNGNVDVINDTNCTIYVGGITPYPNLAALVAAHPTWTVSSTGDAFTGTLPFVIAERVNASEPPALWTVGNITLGKGGK